MEELTYNALDTYFTRVRSLGYMSYSSVDSILALLYIQYLKDNYDLNNEETAIVDKALSCLQGSNCLISYN